MRTGATTLHRLWHNTVLSVDIRGENGSYNEDRMVRIPDDECRHPG